MLYTTIYKSPLGEATIASDGKGISGLWLEGQKYFAASIKEKTREEDERREFHLVKEWLDQYFAGGNPPLSQLPLTPRGTEFQRRIWDILCQIPYGKLTTYGEMAKEMAALMGRKSMSSQAVGGAVGHNPISIIIPCHRVVGSNGSLTGYAGGIHRKVALLELEGADMTGLYVPAKGTAL